jgi:hypothetical protein
MKLDRRPLIVKQHNFRFVVRLAVGLFCALSAMPESFARPQGTGPGVADLSAPKLAGRYVRLAEHPGVFTTRSELNALAKQINVPGSYSAKRFHQLAAQVKRDVSGRNEWGAAYSGCNLDIYTYAFSYEPQTTHNVDHATKVSSALGLNPNSTPPAGAAVVASRLALYAALLKAGATLAAGEPSAEQAAAIGKQILVAWSAHGFQDGHGRILSIPSQFCDDDGRSNVGTTAGAGLAVARGVIYSVQAQDLLMYVGTLSDADAKQINAFHSAMYELLRNALNYNFSFHAWACDHFSNHAANQLTGLLALARILDNQQKIEAVLYGRDKSISVTLPWTSFFERAIYGNGDKVNACYANKGPDGDMSKPFFQTVTVAPGEIDDRYRNADASQGIGYPMFTLERLLDAAELLRGAGYDAYGYHGIHGQSIETATAYYGCYAKTARFGKTITPENSHTCPDAAQYYGKIVNGVDRMITVAALRFPQNQSITDLEPQAKTTSASGPFSLDAILFGKWRD